MHKKSKPNINILTLTKQKTTFTKTFVESINQELLDDLIESNLLEIDLKERYKCSERTYLKSLRKELNNGVLSVKYNKPKSGYGRVQPKRFSLSILRRAVRHTLCEEQDYVDIDIKNCHPTILYQLCKRAAISCSLLEQYINDRENMLEQVGSILNMCKEEATSPKTVKADVSRSGSTAYRKDLRCCKKKLETLGVRELQVETPLRKSDSTYFAEMLEPAKPGISSIQVRAFLDKHNDMKGTVGLGVEFLKWLLLDRTEKPIDHVTMMRCDLCYEDWESTYVVKDTEHCDHFVCIGCMVANFRAALKDGSLFRAGGIKCPMHGCNETMVASGFNLLVDLAKDLLPDKRTDEIPFSEDEIRRCHRFMAKSTILVHRQIYCQNPYCCGKDENGELLAQDVGCERMITKYLPWACKYCKSRKYLLCRRCKEPWHPKVIDCDRVEEYKDKQEGKKRRKKERKEQSKLEKQDRKNQNKLAKQERKKGKQNLSKCKKVPWATKKCPWCKAKIIKSGGCLHMKCGYCQGHFCWRCKKKGKSSEEIYRHCRRWHGGYRDWLQG